MLSKRSKQLRIYLGGGCFWSKEYHLSKVPGVTGTQVGFMGGTLPHPTYKQVCTKTTGHAEVVAVDYDPAVLPTRELLFHFFSIHDPRVDRRDKGGQYRSGIYFTSDKQAEAAQGLIAELTARGHSLSTELQLATDFWVAEERHQQYCETKGLSPRPTKGLLRDLEFVRLQTDSTAD